MSRNYASITRRVLKGALALFLILGLATMASAQYAEVGDAGQTLPTAQATTGTVGFITGTVTPSGNADMFAISYTGVGALTAQTNLSMPAGAMGDPQLFLFNSAGVLVALNDDFFGLQSFISFTGPAGTYFIAISAFNNDPVPGSIGGTHTGAWTGGGGTGNYRITFSGNVGPAGGVVIPEPASLTLAAIGLVSLAGYGWRRKKAQIA